MKTNLREKIYNVIQSLPSPLKYPIVEFVYQTTSYEKSKAITPLIMNLFVTDNCNLLCSHCFYAGHLNKQEKTTLKEIETMIKSLKNPLVSVILTGGETFLRKDIAEICVLLDKAKTKKVIMPTNGSFTDKVYQQVKEILKRTDLDVAIQLSLDGPEKTHDHIRGVKGSYEKAIKTLKKLKTIKSNKLSLSISTTVSKANYETIKDFLKETKPLKVFHGIQFVRSASKHVFNIDKNILSDFDSEDPTLSMEQMEYIQKLVKINNNKATPLLSKTIELVNEYFMKSIKEKKRFMPCTAGYVDAVVYPDGGVSVCEFTKPFANLNDFNWDFYKLWTSDKANQMRKKTSVCVCTHQCNLMNSLRYDKKSIKTLFSNGLN
jgi:MoaA/NifB/PqqE/SkfB family radical SAM enzyme